MSNMDVLVRTVAALRAPDGCPWDRAQTHQSLAQCLVDECSELLETIDRGDMPHMREELGDVLLQVVLHAQIASEAGHFGLEEVAGELNEKLIRRHPHVFGEEAARGSIGTAEGVITAWDQIKAAEKAAKNGTGKTAPAGLFKELPPRLPALLYAWHVCKQMEKQNLPWPEGYPRQEELELQADGVTEKRLGRALLRWVAVARAARIDPESALRRAVQELTEVMADAHTADARG